MSENENMLTEERFVKILEVLEKTGSVTVGELMQQLDASESTIRRDLNTLDANGKLTKVHGGAIAKASGYYTRDDEVDLRKNRNMDEKVLIAKYAASLIKGDDFVYIDAGTSTERMIDFIDQTEAVFVTNAFSHARKLAKKGCRVYILGGEFKAKTEAVVGEEAVESISKYNFTKGFFGVNGITRENGFSTPEVKEAMVKRKAMENARESYILADSSKFQQISAVTFGAFQDAYIVTTEIQQAAYRSCKNIMEVK